MLSPPGSQCPPGNGMESPGWAGGHWHCYPGLCWAHPALFAPHSTCACYLNAFPVQCSRKSSSEGIDVTLKGLSGLPGRCLQLCLSCTGETPLGREESRKGLGKHQGRETSSCFAWPKYGCEGFKCMSAWFGVRRRSGAMGMRKKPTSQQHLSLHKSSSWALRGPVPRGEQDHTHEAPKKKPPWVVLGTVRTKRR